MRKGSIVSKGMAVLLCVVMLGVFAPMQVFADTPVQVGHDAAGNESILVSNVVNTWSVGVRLEGMSATIRAAETTAPATVTMARDISVLEMWEGMYVGNGFPITQIYLPPNVTYRDYFNYMAANSTRMNTETTVLPLTTGTMIPDPNPDPAYALLTDHLYIVPEGSTVVLGEGLFRVSMDGSFGTPFLYIIVHSSNEAPVPVEQVEEPEIIEELEEEPAVEPVATPEPIEPPYIPEPMPEPVIAPPVVEAPITPTVQPANTATVTNAHFLNLRRGAGISYNAFAVLTRGDTVTVLGQRGGWVNVETDRGTGWVFGRYLDIYSLTIKVIS